MILAAISINLILGQHGVIQRAKWSSFITRLTSIEEKAMLTRNLDAESFTEIDYTNTDIFDGLYDEENISATLKKSIVEVRENNTEISQEEANSKYEGYKDAEGKITDIYYISDKIGEKKHKYIYDSKTNTAFEVKGEVIFGQIYHYYKANDNSSNDVVADNYPPEPSDPDMPAHEPLQESEIPIYTIEQYGKIASNEQNYVINDLSGNYIGTYNMNADASYKIMNDIDFKDKTTKSIKGFKGTFNGNSYVLKNITIDNKDVVLEDGNKYYYYSKDNLKTGDITNEEVKMPAGLFDRTIGATIKNVKIDNATISGNENVGIIAGEIVETNIEKCIVENSNVLTTGYKKDYNVNGVAGGIVGWVYNQNTSAISEIKVDNVNVVGPGYVSGLIGMSTSKIEITGCKVKNSTVYMSWNDRYPGKSGGEAQAGILADAYDSTTITNCYVGKTTFKNDLTQLPGGTTYGTTCAGILGATGWYGSSNKYNIQITESSIVDTKLAWGCNVGGICGSVGNNIETLNLENCNAKNIETATGTAIGGILGYTYSKTATIKNCDTDGFNVQGTFYKNSSQNLGGVAGYLASGTLNIQDCDATKLKFTVQGSNSGASKQIAGILGASESGYEKRGKITNCTVSNSEIKYDVGECEYGYTNMNICGITGYNSLDIGDCTISKTKMFMLTDKENLDGQDSRNYWNNGVEGICGYSSASEKSITNCKVLDTEMRNELGQTHGICAYSNGTASITNFVIENSNIYALNFAAGGVGEMGQNLKLDGFTAKNTNIISEAWHAAGVTTQSSSYTIENANIEGCNIGNTRHYEYGNDSDNETGYKGCVAGIASVAYSSTIKNCKVIDTKLTNHSRNTGGIIAYSSYGSNPITGCEVKNITIYSEGRDVGGIAGDSGQGIENCIVDGGTITTNREGVGGLAGVVTGNLKDCSVKNITITTDKGMVGGIAGCLPWGNTYGINNCDIEKVNINSNGVMVGGIAGYFGMGFISDSDVTSSKVISENYNVGGIVGIANNIQGNINNCTVNSSEVSGKDFNVGGIVGQYVSTTADAKITGCIVKDSKVTETGADASSVGGIVGNGYNFYTDTLTPNTTIEACTVSNTTITGVDDVGGINGAVATSITGCIVDKNSKITGRNNVGGIQGYSGTLGSISGNYTRYDSSNIATIQETYSGTAGDYGNITNCNVTNATIEGKSDINYIRGKNVGTAKEDGCTNTDVTLNTI